MDLLYLFFILLFSIAGLILIALLYFFSRSVFNFLIKTGFLIIFISFFLTFILLIKNSYIVSEYDFNLKKSNLGIPYEKIILFNEDNIMLTGWVLKYHSNSPTIILSHGLGDSKLSVLNIAKKLYQEGYNCILFDFRAHGESEGKITSFGYREQKDLRTFLGYVLSNPSFKNKNLGLYGVSMGAAVSILVAKEYDEIKAIVSDSSYTNLQQELENQAKFMYHVPKGLVRYPIRVAYMVRFLEDPKDISPLKTVETIFNKAIFFINEERNVQIPPNYTKKLYKVANGPKKLWIIPGATSINEGVRNSNIYEKKIIDFFKKYLPLEPLWKRNSG